MVRFQSPRSDRNSFRRSGSLVRDRSANRRLFRMILALGLVLIVMQRAGDPKVYRMFFPELQETVAVPDEPVTALDQGSRDRTDSDDPTDKVRSQIDSLPKEDDEIDATAPKDAKQTQDDQRLLDEVSSGAIWSKADQPAFYRLLSTGGRMAHLDRPAQQLGALSLLNQPEVYLKTKVLVIGKLGRVEQITAKTNDFGIDQYYQLWIDPNDASQQPITCFCRRLLPSLMTYVGQPLIHDRPRLHVEGVYLKRIAYASQVGSQLAPAIVGRITAGPAAVQRIATGSGVANASSSTPIPWKWLVALAAAAALAITFIIYRVSNTSSRRFRQARQQSQRLDPLVLLGSLPTAESPDSSSNQPSGT